MAIRVIKMPDIGEGIAEVGHADDVNAHGSITRRYAAATRSGPGK